MLLVALIVFSVSCGPTEQEMSTDRKVRGEGRNSTIAEHEITAEEYAVYSDLIEVMYFRNWPFPGDKELVWFSHLDQRTIQTMIEVIVIGDHTFCEESYFQILKMDLDVSEEILDDFRARNGKEYKLEDFFEFPDKPELADKIVFASQKKRFRGKKTQGHLTLSRVGFNSDRTEALVYVGNQLGGLEGSGLCILLSKEEARWVVQKKILVWVS
jgi:hypothetical protein